MYGREGALKTKRGERVEERERGKDKDEQIEIKRERAKAVDSTS
jgi:hypothetical protein